MSRFPFQPFDLLNCFTSQLVPLPETKINKQYHCCGDGGGGGYYGYGYISSSTFSLLIITIILITVIAVVDVGIQQSLRKHNNKDLSRL